MSSKSNIFSDKNIVTSIYNAIDIGICITDKNNRIIQCNSSFCRLLQYNSGDLEKKSFLNLFPDKKKAKTYIDALIKGDINCSESILVQKKDSTVFEAQLTTGVIKSEKNIYHVFTITDLTESRKTEKIITRFGRVLERSYNEIYIFDAEDFTFIQVNHGALQNLGYSMDEIKTFTPWDLKPEYSKDDFLALLEPLRKKKNDTVLFDTYHVRKNGSTYPVEVRLQLIHDETPPVYVGIMQDITKRKEAEERLQLATEVFDNSVEGIMITDKSANIIQINSAFTEITGYSENEILNQNPKIFRSGWHDRNFYNSMWRQIRKEGIWQGEMWDRKKDGSLYAVWETIIPVKNSKNEIINYIGIFYDVTEKKRSEDRIQHLAYYDALTDLPNRNLLYDRLNIAIQEAERSKNHVALLFFDLDDFKKVNDTLGHHIGDMLLKNVAERVKKHIRKYDTLSRQGGDEFTIILPEISTPYDAANTVHQIFKAFKDPFELDGNQIFITSSIGIAIYPIDGMDMETLMKNADTAMYAAKKNEGSSYQFFTSIMNKDAMERLVIENKLRFAVQKNELSLHYQPQIDISNGKIIGTEALLRWDMDGEGIIAPGKFIPIAESSGIIIELGEWILEQACREQTKWEKSGFPVSVAVNISLAQLKHQNFITMVMETIERTGIQPHCLELEITESFFMENVEDSIEKIRELKSMGILISIDDFGTGYSSLSYLKNLPIDKLKIDKSFIDDITHDSDGGAIVIAILHMGHSLNLKTIAEGVEEEKQLNFLKAHMCKEVQGYYFSKPLDQNSFFKYLKKSSRH